MLIEMNPVQTAQEIGASSAQAQLWVLLVVGFMGIVWLVKQLRAESNELRNDLREQAKAREVSMEHLIRCVDANTSALHDNSSVLSETKHQLRRSEEVLNRFSS